MTPAYAAPEQIRGGRDRHAHRRLCARRDPLRTARRPLAVRVAAIDPRLKWRASIAGGQRPSTPSAIATARRVRRDNPVRAAEWADLDVLCLTAMHKDPQRRYATVEALDRDVDHYLNGEPLEARPDSLGYRVGKFVTRNRRVV